MKTINISICDDAKQLISIESRDNHEHIHPYHSDILISPTKMDGDRKLLIDSKGIIDMTSEDKKKNILVVYNTCHPYSIAYDTYEVLKYEISSGISLEDNHIYLDSCGITFCNLNDIYGYLKQIKFDMIFGNSEVLVSMFPKDCEFYSSRLLKRCELISYVVGLEDN